MLSNNLKHIVDFVSIPINGYNELLFSVNHTLHNLIRISENAAGNNWDGEAFTVNNHLNEDTAGSFIHALFILLSICLVFKIKNKAKLILLFFYCFIAFSFYGLLFKYTPFDIRLLLPLLILLIIISTYTIYTYLDNKHVLNGLMTLFIIIAIFPVYFNRAKPILGNPFYLRREIMYIPKGVIDNNILTLLPVSQKEIILGNYILKDSMYFLKSDLSLNERKALFYLEDSIGFFDYDKRTVFQKSRVDNYFPQIPNIKENLKSIFDSILNRNIYNKPISTNSIVFNLKTEFDSFEYLIWVYAKSKIKNGFYIGNADTLKYRSYSKNSIDPKLYNIELSDKNKNWTISYKH
jgi:hypothetical protein